MMTGRLCCIAMALMIIVPALFPMVVAAASTQYTPRPPGNFYLCKDDSRFNIYYDSSRITDIGEVVVDADAAYTIVEDFFGPYGYRVSLILAADHEQYASILTLNLPGSPSIPDEERSGSWGSGDQGTILIEMPAATDNFTAEITHELAHIVIRSRLTRNEGPLPEWFSEGLATYVSGGLSGDATALIETSARSDRLLTISQIEDILENPVDPVQGKKNVGLARAQSAMIIKYMVEKYGKGSVIQVLQDFGSGSSFDRAFLSQVGCTPEDINAGMAASLKGELAARDRQETAQQVYGCLAGEDGMPIGGQAILFTPMGNGSASFGKVYRAVTDELGRYSMNLTYGTFAVHVEGLEGYHPFDGNITIARNEAMQYNIVLPADKPMAQSLSPDGSADACVAAYALLAILNVFALLLIGLVFWHAKR